MPLVNDGVYKIHNVKFSPPHVAPKDSQVADLVNGAPGPINGRQDFQAHNDQWYIKNKYHEPTSNSVTIENFEHRGIYAYAHLNAGASVEGKRDQPGDHDHPTVWTLVARGNGKYNIQSPNNNLIWDLQGKNQNIKLGTYVHGTQEENEWTFQKK
ncbi:hypothetical protein HD554DRAFT_2042334 [Boletus coccyginus]|nr:hypothetical protein HD554DRAFT_2042334 [Boletus coccyginus]